MYFTYGNVLVMCAAVGPELHTLAASACMRSTITDSDQFSSAVTEEDDLVDQVVMTSPLPRPQDRSTSDGGFASTVYAPIRQHIPEHLWRYCPEAFLNSAVAGSHADDQILRSQCPADTFPNTFVIKPCARNSEYMSSPVVNSLHNQVPVSIFVALGLYGIIDQLEGKPLNMDDMSLLEG